MTWSTNEIKRIEAIETMLNNIQTALSKLTTRAEVKGLVLTLQRQVASLSSTVSHLELTGLMSQTLSTHLVDINAHLNQLLTHFYTEGETDTLLDDKSDTDHLHNDTYYTEDEINTLLAAESDTSHTHHHDTLSGLADDDHTQYLNNTRGDARYYTESEIDTSLGNYILVNGTRSFTGPVSGIAPTLDLHLSTKKYVDDSIAGFSTDHGDLTGLTPDDDHPQYILVNGTRGFTATVSGITPTENLHLATKQYIDDAIAGFSTDHGALTGLLDVEDHPGYVTTDATRGVNGTLSVSGLRLLDGQWYGPDPVSGFPTGTTQTIDWDNGNAQALDLESATGNLTVTFLNGQRGSSYILETIQDTTTPRDIIWPANVKWPDGLTPVVSVGVRAIDIFTAYYNGSVYFMNRGPNYS